MNKIALATLIAAAGLTAACQSVPPRNLALDDAHTAVMAARNDPDVARAAPVQLQEAEAALRLAQDAWTGSGNEIDTRHLAYIAVQRANIARHVAATRLADVRTAQAVAERDRLAAARTQEMTALAQAQTERQQLQQQQMQTAEQRARDEAFKRQVALLGARSVEGGAALTLPATVFEADGARLRGVATLTAERIAQLMRQYPERRLLIESLADSAGSTEQADLSQRRAEAFRSALVERGIAPGQTQVQVGDSHRPAITPLAGYAAGERAPGRREAVRLLFSDAQGQFPGR